MRTRSGRINWSFILVFVLAAGALGLTIGGLWYWNKHLRAQRGLRMGLAAYESREWTQAADYLGQYLAAIQPQQDVEILLKYAEAQLNQRPVKKGNIEQALRAYHQILQVEDHLEARRFLIEMYLLSDPLEAERQAQKYLEKKFDPQIVCYAARALMERRQFSRAFEQLRDLLQKDPSCIHAYILLAQAAEQSPELSEKKPREWLTLAVDSNPQDPLAYLVRARHSIRNHLQESGEADIRQAESLNPQTREQKLQLVSVCLLADQLSTARHWLDILQCENAQDLMLWTLWAQWALQNGSEEEMIRIAKGGLDAIQPDSYDYLGTAAELFIRARQWEDARATIQQLIDRQERTEVVSYLEGLLAQARGDWPGAVAAWRKIIASPENNITVQIKLAQALEQMGDRTAAIQQLRTLLMGHPEEVTAHSLLARWSADAGHWTEALDHARQALRLQPDDLILRKLLIEIKIRQSQAANLPLEEEEWKQIQELLKTSRTEDPALDFIRVQVALRNGRLEEAENQLNRIEERGGDGLQIHLLRAELQLARQQTQEAGRILDEAITQYPESLEPIQKRIVLFLQNKEFESCLEMLRRSQERIASDSKRKTLRLWTVEILVLAGREETAVEELKALAQEDTRDIAVRRRLLDLTLKTESLPRLQQQIEGIKTLEGESGRQWRYEQARFLFERGDISRDYPQLVSILEGILRDYPEDQSSRILLASSHDAAGNLSLAIKEYQDALARDPENLDLVVAAVAAMYKAEEFRQAESIIEFISRRGLRDPRLSRLEAQQLLKQGKFGSASEILKDMMTLSPEDQNLQLSLALIHLYQNELEEAERWIDRLHQSSPDSLPVIAARVELALRKKDPDRAVAICDEAIAKVSDPQLYTLRAVTSAKLGDPEQAEEDLRTMLELNQNSRDSLLLAADLFVYIGKPKQAGQILEQAVTQRPDDFSILKKAALLYARDPQKREAAAGFLERSLAMQPKDPDLRLLKAKFLLAENTAVSTEEAESIITRLVFEYPRIESAWVILADWYYRGGQAGRAMDYVLRGLGFFPESKALQLLKAQIEGMRAGHLAIPTLKNLHQRFPEDDRITAIVAETCLRAGQADEALAVLRQRIEPEMNQSSILLQQLYMMALYTKGQVQEAEQLYEKLNREGLDPVGTMSRWAQLLIRDKEWNALDELFRQKAMESPELLAVAGEYCLQIGMEEDPRGREMVHECLLFLIANRPDQADLYLSLGRLYHFWEQYKSAVQIYRKILDLDVSTKDSTKVIAMNNLAWILSHEYQNYREALQIADRALEIEPENADLLDTRGEILFMTGDYEKAKKDLEKSIRLYPSNSPKRAGSGYRLVKTLIKMGENTEAVELYKQVEQWNQANQTLSKDQINELHLLLKSL